MVALEVVYQHVNLKVLITTGQNNDDPWLTFDLRSMAVTKSKNSVHLED